MDRLLAGLESAPRGFRISRTYFPNCIWDQTIEADPVVTANRCLNNTFVGNRRSLNRRLRRLKVRIIYTFFFFKFQVFIFNIS